MEEQKILHVLISSKNNFSKSATRKWYGIDSESKGSYSHSNQITFLTKPIESSLCDYSDAYILVTGNIVVTRTIVILIRIIILSEEINHSLQLDKKPLHHLKIAGHKLMIRLLIMHILLILHRLSTY